MNKTTRSSSEERKKERDTRTRPTARLSESEKTEKESACYTRVSQQTLDPIHSPSKFIRISHASTLNDEVHNGHVGEEKERGWGGGNQIE